LDSTDVHDTIEAPEKVLVVTVARERPLHV